MLIDRERVERCSDSEKDKTKMRRKFQFAL